MTKKILVIDLGREEDLTPASFMGVELEIHRVGCCGDIEAAKKILLEYDGKVDVIALEGMPAELQLGQEKKAHILGIRLRKIAQSTPVVDGSGVRDGLERWGVILADREEPGIFSKKRVLMAPGLNHQGLAQALQARSQNIRYADPVIYFALRMFPGMNSSQLLKRVAAPTLDQLRDAPYRRIFPQPGAPGKTRHFAPFHWADVLAGDIGAIRRYAPRRLAHKTVVVNSASEKDIEDLRSRGVSIVVVLIPNLPGASTRSGFGVAVHGDVGSLW
jgi:hypothetical protein